MMRRCVLGRKWRASDDDVGLSLINILLHFFINRLYCCNITDMSSLTNKKNLVVICIVAYLLYTTYYNAHYKL